MAALLLSSNDRRSTRHISQQELKEHARLARICSRLATQLRAHPYPLPLINKRTFHTKCGASRIRTDDPLLAKQVL